MNSKRVAGVTFCALALLGCSGEVEPGDDPAGSAAQALSYSSVRATLNSPPKLFWTAADEAIIGPIWTGDNDKGQLYSPIWRGANAAMEDLVYAPEDGDCTKLKGTVRIDWNKAQNTVHVLIKARGLPVSPVIDRTEGVDFVYNPFHQRLIDFNSGAYRLWMVFATINTANTDFYYDQNTNLLLGSVHDFPGGPPPNSITVGFPIFPLVSSDLMYPDAQGNIVHQYTVPYDHITQEGGQTGHAIVTFLPHDLCQSNAFDPTAGQLRPYVSPWLPLGTGPSWKDVLRSGLFLDMTLEDTEVVYPNNDPPYVFSGVAFLNNVPAVQGGVPNGQHFQTPSAIRNVAPVIAPIAGGNGLGCQPFVSTPKYSGPDYCASNP